MAFERGIAAPSTIVADLPRHFGTYAPENFGRDFAGRVTAADALRLSLNLPAVALLDQVGALRFASALKLAGAAPRLPRGADASLPLALGGAGTTLREMTALYATIADHGRALPLRLTPGEQPEAQQAVERRAADAVAAILVQNFSGGGPAGWRGRQALPGVGAMPGHWASMRGMSRGCGSGGRMARRCRARPGGRRRCPCWRASSRCCRKPRARGCGWWRMRHGGRRRPGRLLRLLFPPPGAALAEGTGPVTLRAAAGGGRWRSWWMARRWRWNLRGGRWPGRRRGRASTASPCWMRRVPRVRLRSACGRGRCAAGRCAVRGAGPCIRAARRAVTRSSGMPGRQGLTGHMTRPSSHIAATPHGNGGDEVARRRLRHHHQRRRDSPFSPCIASAGAT